MFCLFFEIFGILKTNILKRENTLGFKSKVFDLYFQFSKYRQAAMAATAPSAMAVAT